MATYHLYIPVRAGIEHLKKGRNFLDCTPSRALKIYTDYENAGKEFYSGCDNEDENGKCKGHNDTV